MWRRRCSPQASSLLSSHSTWSVDGWARRDFFQWLCFSGALLLGHKFLSRIRRDYTLLDFSWGLLRVVTFQVSLFTFPDTIPTKNSHCVTQYSGLRIALLVSLVGHSRSDSFRWTERVDYTDGNGYFLSVWFSGTDCIFVISEKLTKLYAEGCLTCFLGVVAYVYLPHSPAIPKSFFGKSYNIFTNREATILITRVINNDPTKSLRNRKPVLLSHIFETFMDWRLYGHIVAALLSMVMIAPMNTYAPSIIKDLGFTTLQANGLNSVGSACSLIFSISLAFSSDRFRERGFHIAGGFLWGVAGLLWLALAPQKVGKWVLYGIFHISTPHARFWQK